MDILQDRLNIIEQAEGAAVEQRIENPIITKVRKHKNCGGYLGQIFMITVEDKTSDKKLELVIKAAFTDQKIRSSVPIEQSFSNEICFYKEIWPAFKKLERECGILRASEFIPKCLKAVDDKGRELLCLENLEKSNFEALDPALFLEHDQVKFIFQVYGRFHAYSLALQDQRPEEYQQLVSKIWNIQEKSFNHTDQNAKNWKNCSSSAEKCLVPGEDDDVIKKYKKYVGDGIIEQISKILSTECDLSVILHGDCWSKNFMFKYENFANVKKIVDMRFLDFQMVKVSSPVCDLSFCLYSGASQNVMDNLDTYLRIYHESLSLFSQELGIDPKKLFSIEALEEHWRRYSKFGMIKALAVLKMKTIKKEVADRDEVDAREVVDLVDREKLDEDGYKKRVRGLLRHLSEIGAL